MTNHVIALLTYNAGIEKQALGNLGAFLIFSLLLFRRRLSKVAFGLLSISLLLLAPALVGVRTLALGLGLLSLLAVIFKTKYSNVLIASIGAPLFVYLITDWQSVMEFLSTVYDRWYSLLFAIDVSFSNPFGLGNGGYHVYVERHINIIASNYGSERMLEANTFWLSPESDLVYFIASWGILSLLFFSIMGYVIYASMRLIRGRSRIVSSIEKLSLTFASALFFMGISQDNASGLLWWIYFGAAMGIIERYQRALRVEKHSLGQMLR